MDGIGRAVFRSPGGPPYAERTLWLQSWCNLPIPGVDLPLRALRYTCDTPAAPAAHVATVGRAMNPDTALGATAVDQTPEWWPYAPEFPHWHVWRGVAGLLYARRPRTSPPKVVRGKDLTTLRERIISAEMAR